MKKERTEKNTEGFIKLYVPELKQLVESGDEKMCLMIAQLEYWFGHKPDGFYKFMDIPKEDNPAYHTGDSWVEEMGMSKDKIDNALKPICAHYKSYTDYKNAVGDRFNGKMYCRYYNKPSHRMHFLRNHDLANEKLASLSLEKKSPIFRAKYSSKVGKQYKSNSGRSETSLPEYVDAELVLTENTQENNHYIRHERESLSSTSNTNNGKKETFLPRDNGNNVENELTESGLGWMSAKSHAVPFPVDFELTEDMISWAKDKKPNINVHNATEKFTIYKQCELKKNWLVAWQGWILNEKPEMQFERKSGGFSQDEAYREADRILRESYSKSDLIEKSVGMFDETLVKEPEHSNGLPLPSFLKPISPSLDFDTIENEIAKAILISSYQTEPYLINRNYFYSELSEFTKEQIDEGLVYLREKGVFLSSLDDYFFNKFEGLLHADWKLSVQKEYAPIKQKFLETQEENKQRILEFIPQNFVVSCEELLSEIAELTIGKLSVIMFSLIPDDIVQFKIGNDAYFYDAKLYKSDSQYKIIVDEKIHELKQSKEA